MKKLFILIILMLFGATAAWGGAGVRIYGSITDMAAAPIAGGTCGSKTCTELEDDDIAMVRTTEGKAYEYVFEDGLKEVENSPIYIRVDDASGTQTAVASQTRLTDSAQSWTVDELINLTAYNVDDGTSCTITDNDTNWADCDLPAAGEWNTNEDYVIEGMYRKSLVGREITKLSFTNGATQTTFSEGEMLACKYISNQGDTVETDIIFTAVSYEMSFVVIVEEALIIEICPPSGEIFDLNGTALDANDCVDSAAVVGDKMAVTRMLLADGSTWRYSLDTVRGVWTDTGAGD